MKGRKSRSAAAVEAFEEAGVVGKMGRRRVGRFKYRKSVGSRTFECAVEIFPLKVHRKLKRWPEKSERKRRWFKGKKAAAMLGIKELRQAIRNLQRH